MKRDMDYGMGPRTRIELSGKHLWLRVILVVVLVGMAAGFFGQAIHAILTPAPGWQQIKAAAQLPMAGELTLEYYLTSGQEKTLTGLYTQAMEEASRLFDAQTEEAGTLGCLNAHPGETVAVAPALYEALTLLEGQNSRYLYYAPVYEQYRGLYSCETDAEAQDFDPAVSAQIREFVEQACAFAADPRSVQLELLGDNQVRLTVSPEYRAFARENGVEVFLDFFWLRNAFAVDYIARQLEAAGYREGILTSFEGFARVLGEGSFQAELYGLSGGKVTTAGTLSYTGPKAMVQFRAFPMTQLDQLHYYVTQSGAVRTPFIDEQTGTTRAAAEHMAVVSTDRGCAELALMTLPVFTARQIDEELLRGMEDVSAAWTANGKVVSTGSELTLIN